MFVKLVAIILQLHFTTFQTHFTTILPLSMAGILSQCDRELEPIVFDLFKLGKTINQIAKECTELAKHYPDHKKRVEKVGNWHKKYKKLIMLDISKTVTTNIEQSIEKENQPLTEVYYNPHNHDDVPSLQSSGNSYAFTLSNPQIWSEQLQHNAIAKAEHKAWTVENVLPIEREFYLEWYKAMCAEVSDRVKSKKFDSDCKSLINLCLRIANELKKSPSSPNYMQESIAYLNMLKAEEGAITAGFIQRKAKALDITEPQNLEEEVEEIKSILGNT